MDKFIIDRLNEGNFESWRVQFTSLCLLRGCKGALEKAPVVGSASHAEDKKMDDMATALLYLHVEPAFFAMLGEFETAAGKFSALVKMFTDQSVVEPPKPLHCLQDLAAEGGACHPEKGPH